MEESGINSFMPAHAHLELSQPQRVVSQFQFAQVEEFIILLIINVNVLSV